MTVSALLASLLATDPGRPLVTFYDDLTGERVELSVATWANWVAKAAGLLVDECDLERGDTLRLDLPTHWLGTVVAAAAWTVGLRVLPTGVDTAHEAPTGPSAVLCGPGAVETWAPYADRTTVLACALLPLGVRFADPLPAGVLDVGVEIWSQPDAFVALDPPTEDDPAVELGTDALTQGGLLAVAASDARLGDGDRVLTDTDLGSADGLALLAAVLVRRGSLVMVTGGPDGDRLDHLAAVEHATRRI